MTDFLEPSLGVFSDVTDQDFAQFPLAVVFFFNATATPEIYTLSLHDALPISSAARCASAERSAPTRRGGRCRSSASRPTRSEEHTSELQSLAYLVCRLLL